MDRRLGEHQSGRGGMYTRRHRPVTLLFREPHPDRAAAQRRELQLKTWPRAKKLKLAVAGDGVRGTAGRGPGP